jgi:hypothetical protein
MSFSLKKRIDKNRQKAIQQQQQQKNYTDAKKTQHKTTLNIQSWSINKNLPLDA